MIGGSLVQCKPRIPDLMAYDVIDFLGDCFFFFGSPFLNIIFLGHRFPCFFLDSLELQLLVRWQFSAPAHSPFPRAGIITI